MHLSQHFLAKGNKAEINLLGFLVLSIFIKETGIVIQ